MNYRIILMASGLLGMFAVYGGIMWIGAVVGESEDAITGNAIMTGIFTTLMITAIRVGLSQRAKARKRFEAVVEQEFTDHGYVDAIRFSQGAGISLDDARDWLDKRYIPNGWTRVEKSGYNAEYRRS
jgi:hypothetical protein